MKTGNLCDESEKTMKKREWLSLILLAFTVAAAVLIGIRTIYITGVDGVRLLQPATKSLLAEVTMLFTAAVVILMVIKEGRLRLGLLILEAAVFCWIHQAFLPMAVSGIYFVLIIRVGNGIRVLLDTEKIFSKRRDENQNLAEGAGGFDWAAMMADFTMGSMALILLFCLMSLAGIGSIGATRIAAGLIGIGTFLPTWPGNKAYKENGKTAVGKCFTQGPMRFGIACMIAFIFTMVLLQAGRMNICADYDSLHYGLRSEYVLNDGGGIYENLGSINVVYTYSKGLETLLLPISGLPSYSFFLSFQIWMTLGILLMAGEIVRLFVDGTVDNRENLTCHDGAEHRKNQMKAQKSVAERDRTGACNVTTFGRSWLPLFCVTLLAAIPGIMNMGITAKTDSATALFQLVMAYYLLRFVQKQQTGYFAVAGNAFLLTMVLKPTALVFSTVLAGTVFIYLFVTKTFRVCVKDRFLISWIPAVAMWLLIWARTIMITGLPVTSVFTSIWTKLGFTVKYPFKFDSMPSNGGAGWKESIKHFLKRLYGVLLAPVGEDMAHVRIAWGTSLLLIFLVLIFVVAFAARTKKLEENEKRPLACLVAMMMTNGVMSLVALYLLWQVDGNYFILLYCLLAIMATIVIAKLENHRLMSLTVVLFVPLLVFNVSVTAVSNWSGTLGLSPVRVAHKGYFDHWAEAKEQMIRKGNENIWDILAEDPETRVLVYGNQPEMLMFPCNAQSYTDIEGSGGNYYVSASAEGLADFFEYAKIDYVYLCGGYLKPGTEAWNFVVEMIELGYLNDLFYEDGNVLAQFSAQAAVPGDPDAVLEEFSRCYWPGEQQ